MPGTSTLKLRVGDLVEVRSEAEILATLDASGAIDGLPFMPEMLEFCGKRFRVGKRADKTCNTITVMESRRLYDTVHLEDLRCSGLNHGGCQAQCYLFWKESWLKRVDDHFNGGHSTGAAVVFETSTPEVRCNRGRLEQQTRRLSGPDDGEIYYRCQATDLLKASTTLPWWDIRQYARDVFSGNIGVMDLLRTGLFNIFQRTLRVTAYRAQIKAYNYLQSRRGGAPYPFLFGTLEKTPHETLELRPGELVQIKSYEEILGTLNKKNKNRGLLFGPEMVPYCGSVRKVRARVEHIVDEKTGKMMKLPGECLILDGVVCRAEYSEKRLFCPRNIFPFWREIWLKRVPQSLPFEATTEPRDAAQVQRVS